MNTVKRKKLLDFIPFVILLVSAVYLCITMSSSDWVFQLQHYIGLIFLAIVAVGFFKHHKPGVLLLGLCLLLGLVGLLSFSPELYTVSLYKTVGESSFI